jgi:putative ABC transport system substrate-binding protein
LDRRRLIVALAILSAGSFIHAALAQTGRIRRIGLLWIKAEGASSASLQAFREGLRDQGYKEGRDLEIDDRYLVDRYPLLPDAAVKLVDEKVDVIVTSGRTATTAASKATARIPIVAMMAADPVAAGFALSLARPGKNITGVISINIDLGQKRLELLKQVMPKLRIVGVPLNPESAGEVSGVKILEHFARALNVELLQIPVRQPSELDAALRDATNHGVEAFAPAPSTMFVANAHVVVDAVARVRLPAIYHTDDFTRAGGLISYGTSPIAVFRHAAVYVDKILKGAKPAEIPFEQPTKFDLVINLKTAKTLGIAIPKELLLRADRVIE